MTLPLVTSVSSTPAETFRRGSKSFSLAAVLFQPEMYRDATLVYGWCRYCDDAVDGAEDQDRSVLESVVETLKSQTLSAFRGDPQSHPVFQGFQEVAFSRGIQLQHALDLIEGLAMDARKERYQTLQELELYAYRVAGTVGLMMADVMGVSDPRASHHAKQMGIAMQLTNISRDVLEDARLGRIYLPLDWLQEMGVSPDRILDPGEKPRLALVAQRLVDTAERYYAEGEAGICYLPRRAAFAIAAASRIYRAIGHRVVQRGATAWDSRTVVPWWEKIRQLTIAVYRTWRNQ